MADFIIEQDECQEQRRVGLVDHPCVRALGGCPTCAATFCLYCERELPTQEELEAQADKPIPYQLTELGRGVTAWARCLKPRSVLELELQTARKQRQ